MSAVNQSFSQSHNHSARYRTLHGAHSMVNRVSRQSVSNRSTTHRTFHGAHSMVNRVRRYSVIQPVKQPLCQIQNFARCSQYAEPWQPSVSQSVTQTFCQIQNFSRCSLYGEPCQPSVSQSASQTTTVLDAELCTVLTVW